MTTDIHLLDEIKGTLGITNAEIAQIVGLEEAVIAGWCGHGIPESEEKRFAPLAYVAQFMREWYVEEVIPELVRKPLVELDGKSVLGMLANDPERVIRYLSGLFYLTEF